MNHEWPYVYFTQNEMACKCGCGLLPLPVFMDVLEDMRIAADFPFIVTSGARCPAHNSKVASTGLNGPHTLCRAADIAVAGIKAWRVAELAFAKGMTGIGWKQHGPHGSRIIHLDNLDNSPLHPRPIIWSYP